MRKGLNSEDTFHCFITCPVTHQAWFLSPLGLRSENSTITSVGMWANNITQELDKEGCALFFIMLWNIWLNRNSARFSKMKGTSFGIVEKSLRLCAELQPGKLREVGQDLRKDGSLSTKTLLKVNVDGAVFAQSECSVIGMV